MIEIAEALRLVLSQCQMLGTVSRSVVDAVGYALAEDVTADVDSPPHDKSLVDGFAIRVTDVGKDLQLLEQIVAGSIPRLEVRPGTTSHVMTGAPIPAGTESMVMVERAIQNGDVVRVEDSVEPGQSIMRRAAVFASGDTVLHAGACLRPLDIGLLCEVGRSDVLCVKRPTVAVLPTGDELVPCTQVPGAGQIRNSNGPMLCTRVHQIGCTVSAMEVGRDDPQQLSEQIARGLEADILILSGGVSAGVKDLVPATMKALGVTEVFHKVRLKPGKPLWFGILDQAGHRCLVFGLPGNPVSSYVCFELFVLPAIRAISAVSHDPPMWPVHLADAFTHRGNRPTYHPAKTVDQTEAGVKTVRPLSWRGSADMLTMSQADCLIYFMAGDRSYAAGDRLSAYPLDTNR